MRLWQKAACVCALVLALVVAVCSCVTLLYARHTILDMSREQVRSKLTDLAVSFSEMASYYLLDTDTDPVRDSLVDYCFSRFADDSAVLMRDGEILSSALDIDPSRWLAPPDGSDPSSWGRTADQPPYEGTIRGRDVLIAASAVSVRSETYVIYIVEDVTAIHRSLTVMAAIFAAVSLAGIAAGAGAVTLLMRKGARPLASLSAAAKRIAGGEYDIRAQVDTRDEIGDLAADFNTMADAVQRQVSQLRETAERQRLFIGGVNHEFKTPLTAILLHTRLLQKVNLTEAERRESLSHIERQCTWLESLTRKLLRTVALQQDIEKQPILPRDLIDRVRASTQQLMASRRTVLETACDDEPLLVDADLAQSLLVNLVDNAGKAYDGSDADRTVRLTIRRGVMEVSDAGRGIPADALDRIFEPFFMVDKSRSKKNGGSGLGLALVKQIADAHGARLEVDSAPCHGTTVRVILPEEKEKDKN